MAAGGVEAVTFSVTLRDCAIVSSGVLAMAALLLLSVQLGRDTDVLMLLPFGLVLVVGAGWVALLACAGEAWAMLACLVVLVFVNDALFRQRDPGEIGLDWQNALKLSLWALSWMIGICNLPRSFAVLRGGAVMWLSVYLVYALFSSLYSAAPGYSFGTSFGLMGMALFAAALAVTATEKQILLSFALSLLLFMLLGWVAYYALPEIGRSLFITSHDTVVERMCGLAGQPNALGAGLAVLMALTYLLWIRGHIGTWAAAVMGGFALFTLLVADSRTALLAVMAGIAATTLRRSVWLWGPAILGVAMLVLAGLSVQLRDVMSLSGGLSRSGDATELFTLTGRTEIWEFAWDKILLNPWVGYGYNSSKFILPQFDGLPGLKIDEAHNMLLQNLLAVGVVGTIPLVAFLLTCVADFIRAPDTRRDCMTFIILIWGITVAGAFGSTPTVMSLAVFCCLALALQDRPAPVQIPLLSTLYPRPT